MKNEYVLCKVHAPHEGTKWLWLERPAAFVGNIVCLILEGSIGTYVVMEVDGE